MRMCVIRFYCIEKPQSMIIFNHGKGKRQSLICGGIPNSTNGLTSVGYAIVKDMTGLLLKIRITNKQ